MQEGKPLPLSLHPPKGARVEGPRGPLPLLRGDVLEGDVDDAARAGGDDPRALHVGAVARPRRPTR